MICKVGKHSVNNLAHGPVVWSSGVLFLSLCAAQLEDTGRSGVGQNSSRQRARENIPSPLDKQARMVARESWRAAQSQLGPGPKPPSLAGQAAFASRCPGSSLSRTSPGCHSHTHLPDHLNVTWVGKLSVPFVPFGDSSHIFSVDWLAVLGMEPEPPAC